jgi:cell division protein FtsW (lipid II flippase)
MQNPENPFGSNCSRERQPAIFRLIARPSRVGSLITALPAKSPFSKRKKRFATTYPVVIAFAPFSVALQQPHFGTSMSVAGAFHLMMVMAIFSHAKSAAPLVS